MDESQTAFVAQYPGYNFDLDMMKVSFYYSDIGSHVATWARMHGERVRDG